MSYTCPDNDDNSPPSLLLRDWRAFISFCHAGLSIVTVATNDARLSTAAHEKCASANQIYHNYLWWM